VAQRVWSDLFVDPGCGRTIRAAPVESKQRDQRVVACAGVAGGDEHRAEFVAIKPDGVGLAVHLWSPNVYRW